MQNPTFGEKVEEICKDLVLTREDMTNALADIIVRAEGIELIYVHDSPGDEDEKKLRDDVLPKAVVEFATAHDLDIEEVEPLAGHLALHSPSLGGVRLVSMLQSTRRLRLGLQIDSRLGRPSEETIPSEPTS